MTTRTRQRSKAVVNTFNKSVNYTVSCVFQELFETTKARGLKPDKIVNDRKVIENALFTWTSEKSLREIHLEVFIPGSDKALERWETIIEYSSDPKEEVEEVPVQKIRELCKKLKKLPGGADYRIVVCLAENASDIEGWASTNLRDMDEDFTSDVDGFGYGNIFSKIRYRKGKW